MYDHKLYYGSASGCFKRKSCSNFHKHQTAFLDELQNIGWSCLEKTTITYNKSDADNTKWGNLCRLKQSSQIKLIICANSHDIYLDWMIVFRKLKTHFPLHIRSSKMLLIFVCWRNKVVLCLSMCVVACIFLFCLVSFCAFLSKMSLYDGFRGFSIHFVYFLSYAFYASFVLACLEVLLPLLCMLYIIKLKKYYSWR